MECGYGKRTRDSAKMTEIGAVFGKQIVYHVIR